MRNPSPMLGLVLAACAAHTNLEPLGPGNKSPHVSFGGPIVEALGTRIPVPYLTAGIDYGVTPTVNLGFNAHLLPLAYGIVGADAGATWFPVASPGGPTVGLEARLFAFVSVRPGFVKRVFSYPVLSASVAERVGGGLGYAGTNLVLPAARPDLDPDAARQILSPFLGYRWNLGARTALLTEVKWHGANLRSDQLAVNYLHPGGHGALTTLFALQRRF